MSDLHPPVPPVEPTPIAPPASAVLATQPPVTGPGVAVAVEVAPSEPPKKSRRGLWIGLIAGGAALLLLIAAGIVALGVLASQRTPEATTSRFVDALVAGDGATALGMLATTPDGPGYFTADGVYAGATATISEYRVLGSSRHGASEALVQVEVQQGDELYTATVPLVRTGRDFGFLDRWAVSPEVLPKARIINPRPASMGLLINGVDTPAFTGGTLFDLRALPGTYTLEATGGTEHFGAAPVSAPLLLGATENVNIDVSVVLTDAGIAAAQQAIDAQLDACTAQATPTPGPACGFEVIGVEGRELTTMTWTINSRPTVTIEPYTGSAVLSAGWPVVADGPGNLSFAGSGPTGSGSASMNVNQQGVIVFREGAAEFISGFVD